MIIASIVILIVPVLLSVAMFTLAERTVMASMQRRFGPQVSGIGGLLQPLIIAFFGFMLFGIEFFGVDWFGLDLFGVIVHHLWDWSGAIALGLFSSFALWGTFHQWALSN